MTTVAFGLSVPTLAALGLCVLGVLGSVLPLVPGAGFSLAGVSLYWWASGYTEPGVVVFVGLAGLCLVALAFDLLGGAITARVGGASLRTTVAAGGVGLALALVTGPVGLLVGIAGTVFVLELRTDGDVERSGRVALAATVGVLASVVVQTLLTLSVLGAMVWVAVG
jgi:uncharacterized protein YqgC (DUF456 family)